MAMNPPEPRSGLAVLAQIAYERRRQAFALLDFRVRIQESRVPLFLRKAARMLYRKSIPKPHRLRARDLREQAEALRAYARAPWVDATMAAHDAEEGRRRLAEVVATELARAWGVLVNKGRGRALARGR